VASLDEVFRRVRLTIAPLRYGAGLKGKVLDSLAAGIPCVMTPVAAEGLELPAELQALVADEPGELAQRIAALCRDDREYRRLAAAGHGYVGANYSAERIDRLMREACRLTEPPPIAISEPSQHRGPSMRRGPARTSGLMTPHRVAR